MDNVSQQRQETGKSWKPGDLLVCIIADAPWHSGINIDGEQIVPTQNVKLVINTLGFLVRILKGYGGSLIIWLPSLGQFVYTHDTRWNIIA